MWLFGLVYLLTGYFTVHGQSADQTVPATPDIRTILTVVSDLTKQIEGLEKYQLNYLQIVSSLEAKVDSVQRKCDKILEENNRLRERVEILENLNHPDDPKPSTTHEQINPREEDRTSLGKLFINENHSSRKITEHSYTNITTADFGLKSDPGATTVESAPDAQSGNEIPKSTVGFDKLAVRSKKPEHQNRVQATPAFVAFNAYLSGTILDPGTGYIIQFNDVLTNVGDGYNPATGVFKCPIAGLYAFTWCTGMANAGYMTTALLKNGISVAYSFVSYPHDSYPSTACQTSVLMLSYGDILYVKVTAQTSSPALYSPYTSFNGFLLKHDAL
ncbi:Complement C1q-like protein 2 [Mizuhopecten yessoensis]|uniref:Complement C1q-like protein 2 n=2 Tax=Mizuhopecten yessoensis TaxID=6573 RepID=A0A210PUW0_MIZYE|nr:Complement C1q-like protein 2 [Mizuhopecten yessoensis]